MAKRQVLTGEDGQKWYTAKAAARKLRIHHSTLRAWWATGKVHGERRGEGRTCPVYFPESEIKRLREMLALGAGA